MTDHETTPTNTDLYERMDEIERKVDHLCSLVEQASGAWTLMKVLATVVVSITAGLAYVANWIHGGGYR